MTTTRDLASEPVDEFRQRLAAAAERSGKGPDDYDLQLAAGWHKLALVAAGERIAAEDGSTVTLAELAWSEIAEAIGEHRTRAVESLLTDD